MKQTAVEILFKIWLKKEHISPNEWSEALEMEKQQSIDFACEVYNSHYYRDTKSFKQVSEEHYIQTYKTQQNG